MVLHFYFHYKPFPSQTRKERDRERERRESYRPTNRTPAPTLPAPQHRCRHISRTTTEIASPLKTDPPRPIAPHWRPIHPDRSHPDRSIEDRITPDRSTQNQSHRCRHNPWLISSSSCRYPSPISSPSLRYPSPRPISPFPSIFDHSLFLPLLVWPNNGVNELCFFDFCFFKFIDWNFLL